MTGVHAPHMLCITMHVVSKHVGSHHLGLYKRMVNYIGKIYIENKLIHMLSKLYQDSVTFTSHWSALHAWFASICYITTPTYPCDLVKCRDPSLHRDTWKLTPNKRTSKCAHEICLTWYIPLKLRRCCLSFSQIHFFKDKPKSAQYSSASVALIVETVVQTWLNKSISHCLPNLFSIGNFIISHEIILKACSVRKA